jgi:membrane protein
MQPPQRQRPPRRRDAGRLATIVRRFHAENMMQTSAALAFTTLLALVPLVTVILSVAEAVPYLDVLLTRLEGLIQEALLPAGAGKAISGNISRFSHRAQQLTAAGVVFLGATALILMHTIERAFNHVWQVKPRPILLRARLYFAAVLVWPFILAAVASVSYFALTRSLGLLDDSGMVRGAALKLLSVALIGFALALLYLAVPNAPVDRRGAALGGLFAALGFAGMQRAFEAYLVAVPVLKSIYGAFSALPVFLIWLQLSWAVVLAGGLIAATTFRPERR